MSTLASVVLRGLFSALPAASIAGRIYYCSDPSGAHLGQVLRDNGSSWDSLGAFGGGGGAGNVTTSATLTANKPVLGNGTVDVIVGTTSGNTTEVATSTGAKTSGHLATWDASGNLQDGGLPAMVRIPQQVLGSPAASVTFSSIPATYTNLLLVITTSSSSAATSDDVYMQFNGDSTSPHYGNANYYNATSTSALSTYAANGTGTPDIATVSAANSANLGGSTSISICGYANTAFAKSANSSGMCFTGTGVVAQNHAAAMVWNSTAAINAILLALFSGANFITGSVFTLYGIS